MISKRSSRTSEIQMRMPWPHSPRERAAFEAHRSKILHDRSVITKSILVGEDLAGNIVSWEQDGKREVGYWVRKTYWGGGSPPRP